MRASFFTLLLIGLCISAVAAQTQCPPLVAAALSQTAQACDILTSESACYGHPEVKITQLSNSTNTSFTDAGQSVDLKSLLSIETSLFEEEQGTWGIARMSVPAYQAGTMLDDPVTMLLYGEATLTRPPGIEVSATQTVNVREIPNTEALIVDRLSPDKTLLADGRTTNNEWVRVQLPTGNVGWVNTGVVNIAGTVETLPVIEAGVTADVIPVSPTTFLFHGGWYGSPCGAIGPGGLIIQSPDATPVEMTFNAIKVTFQGTLALNVYKAPYEDIHGHNGLYIKFDVLEGEISRTEVFRQEDKPAILTQHFKRGMQLKIPVITNTLLPTKCGCFLSGEADARIQDLKDMTVLLPRPVKAIVPMSEEDLEAIGIQEGLWTFTTIEAVCVDNGEPFDLTNSKPRFQTMFGSRAGEEMVYYEDFNGNKSYSVVTEAAGDLLFWGYFSDPLPRIAPNIYSNVKEEGGYGSTLTFESPTRVIRETISPLSEEAACDKGRYTVIGTIE